MMRTLSKAALWFFAGMGLLASVRTVIGQTEQLESKTVLHVGVVVADVQKAASQFSTVWKVDMPPVREVKGLPYAGRYSGSTASLKVANIRLDNLTLELMEPVGGPSPWSDFLRDHGEGAQHMAFNVPDLAKGVQFLVQQGGTTTLNGNVGPTSLAYVDLTPQLGFSIELFGPR